MAEPFSRGLVSLELDESLDRLEPIVRRRLSGRLARAASRRITVISAPAGFGKSIALKHYLDEAKPERVDIVLRGGPLEATGLDEVTKRGSDRSTAIIVDNVHLAGPEVIQLIASAVERDDGPPWILIGRGMQGLPVASWLAYGLAEIPIDDVDLRFTLDELHELSSMHGLKLTDAEVEEIFDFSDGWPAALVFALKARSKVDRIRAGDLSRDLVFDYLTEQVFRGLDSDDQRFLLDTALLPLLDLDLLRSVDDAAAVRVPRLARSTSFISRDSERRYQYHNLFRRFLEHRLREEGDASFRLSAQKSAFLLEGAGNLEDALGLYVRIESWDDVVRVLRSSGFELLDREAIRTLALALAVPAEFRDRDPLLLALTGAVRAYNGKIEEADAFFALAVKLADSPEIQAMVGERRAAFLLSRGRAAEALNGLEALKVDLPPGQVRTRFLATKAAVRAEMGRRAEGVSLIGEALQDVKRLGPSALEAYILYRASCCELAAGLFDEARSHALSSLRAADQCTSPTIRAQAKLNLYMVARELGDEAERARLLDRVRQSGAKGIDYETERRIIAVEYITAVESGDTRTIGDIERQIQSLEDADTTAPYHFEQAIAMQSAWNGDFSAAQRTLASLVKIRAQGTSGLEVLGQLALYGAASGDRAATEEAAKDLQQLLQSLPGERLRGRSAVSSQILLALAFLVIGRASTANNLLREIEGGVARLSPGLRSLSRAARALYVHAETGAGHDDVAARLDELARSGLGGYARLIRALPLPAQGSSVKFSVLTPTELRVLQALAAGETSRQIAASLGRSALTIDSHVKSLVKKLGCSGRREAIVLARAQGLLGNS